MNNSWKFMLKISSSRQPKLSAFNFQLNSFFIYPRISPETPFYSFLMYYQSSKVQPYSLAVFPKRNEMKRFFP